MNSWQYYLKTALSSSYELYNYLGLDLPIENQDAGFAVRVPRPFADKMQRGNSRDPLLLQVLNRPDELLQVEGFSRDPLGEADANPLPGLLHKYNGRVLIVLSGSCAINCRYCFRRHFSYNDNSALQNWQEILDYINSDSSIEEVILSGGDPLLVDDERLKCLINDLENIKHITTLRIHTRLPVVIPQRITNELLELLGQSRLNIITVLHINHANEIDKLLTIQLKKLHTVSALLNQTVLLRDINDSFEALMHLSKHLFAANVLPYYLHQLDPIQGAHHFYVDPAKGKALIQQLVFHLPGYLVPKYVQELPASKSKVAIA
jgi:EF-P beta-lysylation protein EpmB